MRRRPDRWRAGPAGEPSPGRRGVLVASLALVAVGALAATAPEDPDALVARARNAAERAHATGDADAWMRAGTDLDRALASGHAGARRLLPWVRNGQHRFAEARAAAEALLAQAPDDWWALAQHADACLELGDYAAAEASIDRLAAVRPGPVAWTRVAGLRAVLGDRRGAIAALQLALAATPLTAAATLAWTWADLGTQHLALGELAAAAAAFETARALQPDQPHATHGLARTYAAMERLDAALALAAAAAERQPGVPTLTLLGDIQEARGDGAAAARAWEAAEVAERVAAAAGASYGRDAVLLLVDRRNAPAPALALAQAERQRCHDVGTLDALAWALHASGRSRQAMRVAHRALRLGTEDATLRYHAGAIATALDRPRAARRHLRAALALGPMPSPQVAATRALLVAAGDRLARLEGEHHP